MNPDTRGEFYQLEANVERMEVMARRRRWESWGLMALGIGMVAYGTVLFTAESTWTSAAGVITGLCGVAVFVSGVVMLRWNTQTRAALEESRATLANIRDGTPHLD